MPTVLSRASVPCRKGIPIKSLPLPSVPGTVSGMEGTGQWVWETRTYKTSKMATFPVLTIDLIHHFP